MAGSASGLESHWSADGTFVAVRTGDHALTIADDRAAGSAFRACYRTRHAGGGRSNSRSAPAPPTSRATTDQEMDPAMGVPTR